MASIWKDARSGTYLIKFHFGGQRFSRSCQTDREGEAKRVKALAEETLGLLNTGRLAVPEGVPDVGLWVISGGKLDHKPRLVGHGAPPSRRRVGVGRPPQVVDQG